MATFAEVKAEIADDLARSDLATQIEQAVLDAVEHHSTERFWFNETRDFTFDTVGGDADYQIAPATGVQDFIEIDFLKRGTNNLLQRIHQSEYEAFDASVTGMPTHFAYYNSTFSLHPTPDGVYTMRVGGHYRLIPLAAEGDTNIWTTTARLLIRSTSKLLVGAHVIHLQEDELSKLSQLEGAVIDRLRRETRRRKGHIPLRTDLVGVVGQGSFDISTG